MYYICKAVFKFLVRYKIRKINLKTLIMCMCIPMQN